MQNYLKLASSFLSFSGFIISRAPQNLLCESVSDLEFTIQGLTPLSLNIDYHDNL